MMKAVSSAPFRRRFENGALIFFVLLIGLAGVAPVALIGWYKWDSSRNRGLEIGYFGEYNRVRNSLSKVPGISITREWANEDIVIEEFGFDVTTGSGEPVKLGFGESDPLRSLSKAQLPGALAVRIQQESRL